MSTIVVIKKGVDRDAFINKMNNYNLDFKEIKGLPRHFHILNISHEDFPFSEDPSIECIEDGDLEIIGSASESLASFSWRMSGGNWGLIRHINRELPWPKKFRFPHVFKFNCERDGDGVDIYILDSGISTTYIAERFGDESRVNIVWEGYDSNGVGDDNGHGTTVSSFASGVTHGFARKAEIFSFKVLNSNASAISSVVLEGMGEALSHYQSRTDTNRPAVVNMSFTFTLNSFSSAASDMMDAGMVLVAAAGNNSENLDTSRNAYPGENAGVICVGGIRADDSPYYIGRSGGTNFGTRIDILAAGEQVYCINRNGETASFNGTSFSAAQVTGAIACILQDYQRLTSLEQVQQVRMYLKKQATWNTVKHYPFLTPLTSAILYLEPTLDYPPVPTLIPSHSWQNIKAPLLIGHRGSENVEAPESTIAGLDYCRFHKIPIEGDFWSTSDDKLVMIHDNTVNRTTNGTGTVSTKTFSQIRELDASQVYRPDIFSPQQIPSFEEFLSYADRCLLMPESKSGAATAAAMATAVVNANLQDKVAIQSFFADDLLAVQDIDSTICTILTSSTTVSELTANSANVWGVAINHTQLTESYIADMQTAGFKVFAWGVDHLDYAESLLSFGIDGIISADPIYLEKANQYTPIGITTCTIPDNLFGTGWKWASTKAKGLVNKNGFAAFTDYSTISTNDFFRTTLPGLRLYNHPSTVKIKTKLFVDGYNATNRWFGIQFCWSTDSDSDWTGISGKTNGYHFAYRINGEVEIVQFIGGVWTILETDSWPSLSNKESFPIEIEINDNTIKVTRTDTGHSFEASDNANERSGYIALVGRGVAPGINQVTVEQKLLAIEPDNISDLFCWYKADSLEYLDNENVSIWPDASENNRDLVQENSESQPIFIENARKNLPAVRFDGISQCLQYIPEDEDILTQPFTIVLVGSFANNDACRLLDSADENNRCFIGRRNLVSRHVEINALTSFYTPCFKSETPLKFAIRIAVFNTLNSFIRENGKIISISGAGFSNMQGLSLMSAYTGLSQFGEGDVSELIIYDKVLSDIELGQIETYLSEKWKISL